MKTVCLDFDGVINDYTGWKGKDELGNPRQGIMEFLDELTKKYKIVVYSSRPALRITAWLMDHGFAKYDIEVVRYKPRALAYIDDRGLKFNGDYDEMLRELEGFKTHWE